MGIQYHDLKPTESIIRLAGREYYLRPFDLTAQVWAYNFFSTPEKKDGVAVLAERLADMNDIEPILRTTWHLLRSKYDFGTYDAFVKKVDAVGQHKFKKISEFYVAVVQTLGVSQPHIEDLKEELELKKSIAAGR